MALEVLSSLVFSCYFLLLLVTSWLAVHIRRVVRRRPCPPVRCQSTAAGPTSQHLFEHCDAIWKYLNKLRHSQRNPFPTYCNDILQAVLLWKYMRCTMLYLAACCVQKLYKLQWAKPGQDNRAARTHSFAYDVSGCITQCQHVHRVGQKQV